MGMKQRRNQRSQTVRSACRELGAYSPVRPGQNENDLSVVGQAWGKRTNYMGVNLRR